MPSESPKQSQPILLIRQSEEFYCIGANCEDTCCGSWDISVDPITLESWKKLPDWSTIEPKLRILQTETTRRDVAAHVNKNPTTGACCFLGADQLCNFQKSYGHEALSHTCKSYPRQDNRIYSITERSLTTSCPEAARLILDSETGLELTLAENKSETGPFFKNIIENAFPSAAVTAANYMPLRIMALQIVQHRKIRIEDRMILLGLFADALQKVFDLSGSDNNREIELILSEFSELLLDSRQNELSNLLSKVPSAIDTKLEFIIPLVSILEPFSAANDRFNVFFKSLKNILLNGPENRSGDIETRYRKNREAYINSFNKSYFLENYIFNLVFSEVFPVDSTEPLQQFLHIALKFCILREHIISLCSESSTPDKHDLVQLFQSFTRLYEHSPILQDACISLMKQVNFTSLPHACILIRE